MGGPMVEIKFYIFTIEKREKKLGSRTVEMDVLKKRKKRKKKISAPLVNRSRDSQLG